MPKDQVTAAAIDLGSNSFRLLIGSRTDRGISRLLKMRTRVSLGQGLTGNGIITPESIKQALAALAAFRTEIDRLGATTLRCCGTEAFRRSVNPEALTIPAGKILGTPIEILDGYAEAELSSLGATSAVGDSLAFPCLIVDVGGGSTELILLSSAKNRPLVASLPVGVITFAAENQETTARDFDKLAGSIKFLTAAAGLTSGPMFVMATGGTAGCLAALDLELPCYDEAKVHGHFLTGLRIREIYNSLAPLSVLQRKDRKGLEAGREVIIMPGLEIYQEILATIGCEGMMVSAAGLLEGILLSIT